MADLIEKFFKKDLTEAEEKALEEILLSSDEEASRFGDKAIRTYESFGLPEPRYSGRYPFARKISWGRWALPWLALLGSAAFAASVPPIRHAIERVIQKAYQAVVAPEPTPVPAPSPTPVPVPTALPAVQARLAPPPTPVPTLSAPPLLGAPALAPRALQGGTPGSYANLSVAVFQKEKGPLRVRVLDSAGKEVKLLFQGNLDAGNWAFDWDGSLQDGKPATPGEYQIEVKSDTASQRKDVVIR